MEFKSFDGKIIYIHEWLNVKNPKGIVQIIHGMAEHAERYTCFAEFLNQNGYLVIADDHRGHGKTDKDTLGYSPCDMFESTVLDEGEITKHYKEIYPKLKYFIFGFSYGSFIAQSYIGKYGDLIDGAIIAGSNKKKDLEVYAGLFVANFNILLGREKKPGKLIEHLSFGAYAKHFSDREWISNDAENNKKYHEDAYCGFTCSYRFYADFFKGLTKLYTQKYIESLNKDLPLLLYAGKEDPVGNMGKGMINLYRFYKEKAKIKDINLILLNGYRHEFLGVRDSRQERFRELLEFFNAH